ncbi:MAG: hypothetical protein C0490_08390, partial [Marivirga sp.]|nr:hypothetical protein [Marivirga sp.]
SQVLNHNFFQYYVDHPDDGGDDEKMAMVKKEASGYLHQLELSRKEIDYLRKIIKLMEDKAELVQQLSKENMIFQ